MNDKNNIFSDLRYICEATNIILDSLKKGCDVAQLSNGDLIITEVRTINTQFSWNQEKKKMLRTGRS
ncbi:MAG: DUF2671 domain-containing protein [Rickettsiaceae bacterium]|nr:DUF2671 domain-containing protein [Rickettsiaceae bacterium]